jgi:hypothetical protein
MHMHSLIRIRNYAQSDPELFLHSLIRIRNYFRIRISVQSDPDLKLCTCTQSDPDPKLCSVLTGIILQSDTDPKLCSVFSGSETSMYQVK